MIKPIVNKYKSRLILTTLLSALSAVISILLLAQINKKINITNSSEIYAAIPYFLGLILMLFAVGFFSQLLLAKLGSSFIFEIRNALLKKTISVNYENLEKIGGHRVLATITTDVSNIAMSLAMLPVFVVNLSTILFCLVYLALQSFSLFAFLIIGLLISTGISILIMKKGRTYFVLLREQEDDMFNTFKALVDGSKELNINQNRRNFFYEKQATPAIHQVRDTEIKAKNYWVLSENMVGSMIFLILGVILFVAHILLGTAPLVLTGFILFTTYMISPLLFVQSVFQTLVRGRVAYKKIGQLNLSHQHELTDSKEAINKQWRKLDFNGIKYTYPDTGGYQFAIGPIDLSIQQGEMLFVCGGNGSGKSTFAKILSGLYQQQEGRLVFAGKEITAENKQWYRNHFSTIFSDFHLFQHALNSKGDLVEQQDTEALLKELKLDEKIAIENGKVSSTQLSQGQRKRVAMLLSCLEDASIYLFDEWAADQDPLFRNYFYTQLLPRLKAQGKTVIAITHDDKYFHLADRIVEFEGGQVIEKTNIEDINIIKVS